MIDILMSTFNGEKYLKEQIDSILSQTYTDWRLIIRDDGSNDATVAIIDQYVLKYEQKVIKLYSTGNLGPMRSFEVLLKYSTAKYIMFADQDDIWLPYKIEHAMLKMLESEKETNPVIVFSDLKVVDSNLVLINESFFMHCRINPDILETLPQLSVNNCVTGCTMLINQYARLVALPFGKNAIMHDSWISLKVLSEGGMVVRNHNVDILYRQHSKNELGAVALHYNFGYFFNKIIRINKVVKDMRKIYAQANEVTKMSFFSFLRYRITYLLKR